MTQSTHVAENWQSEFLQFFLFIFTTIWLVQKGSPESKVPGDEGPGSDADQLVGASALPNSPAFAIYLRQRGSSESKPVGAPHHATSVESD